MLQQGRKYSSGNGYRYGFNGKENDKEGKGDGNQQDYGMRIYDPRLGKFYSVDPLTKKYPHYTPYSFAGNKPIRYIDRDGEEELDPDRYYDNPLPAIKNMFAQNLATLPKEQQEKVSNSISYFNKKRETFVAGFRWLSTRFITRWAEGKGGYDIVSYSAVNSLQVDGSIKDVRNELTKQLLESAKSINKEGSYNKTFFSQVDKSGSAAAALVNDVGSSLGSYKLLGRADAIINVDKQGNKEIIIDISYTLADKYQWKKGRGIDFLFIVSHDMMLELEKIGVKPFYIRGYFHQGLRYKNGNKTYTGEISDAVTSQGEHHNYPEPKAENGYSIPESENHIVHDK